MVNYSRIPAYKTRIARNIASFICAAVCVTYPVRAGETDGKTVTTATEEEAPEYKNWIELGIGGTIVNGDDAQFQQEHRLRANEPYGGIQDLHFEGTFDKNGLFSVDLHAMWNNDDYDIRVELSKPNLGYVKLGYTEFPSWYDGNGGFFPHKGAVYFPPPYSEMQLNRGEAWVELGLRLPDWPELTFRYTHEFREGQKDSTIWGDTTLTGLVVNPTTRKYVPAFDNIFETRDIFAFDALKTFGNTTINLGMRYEYSTIDDQLQLERGAGQLPPVVPPPGAQRFITQRDINNVDLFSGHGIFETHFSDSLWFTAGYSYTTLGSDIGGTRIIGTHSNSAFGEPVPTLQPFDQGFVNLAGTSQVDEQVFSANLLWAPLKDLNVLLGFRYTYEDQESDSMFLDTEVGPVNPANFFGPQKLLPPVPTFASGSNWYNTFAERLELRYAGIANWLFYVEGEWGEEWGNVRSQEEGGVTEEPLNKDTSALAQKYTAGANWYPSIWWNLSAQYYYKLSHYDEDVFSGEFPRLQNQDWNVNDVNVRITFRPKIPACLGTISLTSRYDFMYTTIDSQWFFEGELFNEEQTGVIKQNVFTEAITWNPLPRFYLQTNFSYTLNQTDTPANNISLVPLTSPTVTNFRNDYWTVTSSTGYIIDDKTTFNTDFSFYCANDYFKNAGVAMPYGLGATEYTASASLTRQLNKNMSLLLRYGYFNYRDVTSGGHNNYRAHSLYSGLQVRF